MPDLAVDILTVGENTGNLAHSMNEITKGFRNELTARLTKLTTLVSTGALICAFILVALRIAMGIVTSVFQVSRSLSSGCVSLIGSLKVFACPPPLYSQPQLCRRVTARYV